MKRFLISVIAVAIWSGNLYSQEKSGVSQDKTLILYGADAVEHPIEEAAVIFGQKEGVKVQTNFLKAKTAISIMKEKQIGDIFIPAREVGIKKAEEADILIPNTKRGIAYLGLGIAVPKGNPKKIHKLEDLAREDLKVGMGDKDESGVGEFGYTLLEKTNLKDKILPRVTAKGNCCTTTLALLTDGEVDAVIGWESYDKWEPEKVDVIQLPIEERLYTSVPAAIVKYSKDKELAEKFLNFLASGEGKEIFHKWGYKTELEESKQVSILKERLPSVNAGCASVTVGNDIFTIGGDTGQNMLDATGTLDTIVKFTPATSSITTMKSKLPSPRKIVSTASDGKYVYIFGGFTKDGLTDEILVFDPTTDGIKDAKAKLPTPRGRTSAIFDGQDIYILGGNIGGMKPTGYLDEILKYDFKKDEITVMKSKLPTPRASRIGAISDGKNIYYFGGMEATAAGKTDQIVRYNPKENKVEVMKAKLPSPSDGGAFVTDGKYVFIFGGEGSGKGILSEIVDYDIANDTTKVLECQLPSARKGISAAWLDGSAYIFGGRTESNLIDDIVKFTPID